MKVIKKGKSVTGKPLEAEKTIKNETHNTTLGTLYAWHMEIKQVQQTVIGKVLLRKKIYDFYKANEIRLDAMFKRITVLQDAFFVIDIDTKHIKHEIVETDGKKENKPVMLEGKEYAEYAKLYNEMMDEQCPIKL